MLKKILDLVSEKHIHGYDELMDELVAAYDRGGDEETGKLLGWAIAHHGALNDYFTAGKLDRLCFQLEMIREQMKYLR